MMRSRRARLSVALGAAALCLGFLGLGGWQLQRLQWKNALIAQVEQRVHAAPLAAPAVAAWPLLRKANDEYRRVYLDGHFLDAQATRVQALTELGAGFWLLAPFRSDDGAIVLVNRGFIVATSPIDAAPTGAQSQSQSQSHHLRISGLLRMSEPGGGFLRNNDAIGNRWYSRDVAAIAAARGLASVAPYFIDQDGDQGRDQSGAAAPAPAPAPGAPVGGLTVISFNNHHLVYALTWFALSLMSAGGCVLVARAGKSTTS